MEAPLREIIIKAEPEQVSIALLEDKNLTEFVQEKRNKQFNVGDFYLGKVKKIMNGLNAAFVDIGHERDAFLHYHDLGPNFRTYKGYIKTAIQHPKNILPLEKINFYPEINKDGRISELIRPGEALLVQISKEAINNKGPRLTTEITLPGRNLVLVPFSNKVSISQKIVNKEERERLRQLILSIKPRNFGVIVRTAAQGKRVAVLDSELRELKQRWDDLVKKIGQQKPPRLIQSEIDRISAYLRDVLNTSFSAIYVNNQALYYEIKDYLASIAPGTQKILKFYTGKADIFDYYNVSKQLKKLFQRIVPLKKGAYLIIEKTEALYVIDVNSGNKTSSRIDQETNAFEVNLEAAEEIARQMRLRDMGGIIVVDFIDMKDQGHREAVYKKMKQEMQKDRAKHNILPLTKFGLMQITRQRVRPEVSLINFEPCPVCNGTGQVTPTILIIDEIESKLQAIAEDKKFKKVLLKTHPFINAYLTKGFVSIAAKWKVKYGVKLKLEADKNYYFLEYNFFDSNGEKISF